MREKRWRRRSREYAVLFVVFSVWNHWGRVEDEWKVNIWQAGLQRFEEPYSHREAIHAADVKADVGDRTFVDVLV